MTTYCRLLTGYVLCLFIDPKDVGSNFLRNVGELLQDWTISYPGRNKSSCLIQFSRESKRKLLDYKISVFCDWTPCSMVLTDVYIEPIALNIKLSWLYIYSVYFAGLLDVQNILSAGTVIYRQT
jgi:hypothetical protein